jgi:hypothetical protein
VAQDAARRKSRVQRVAPQQAPLAQSSQPVLARLVLQSEAPVRELRLAEVWQARASPPPAPLGVLGVLQPEQPYAQEPRVLQPLQVAREWQPEPERQLQAQALAASAALPSRPLLSPTVRLPPRFRRPPHPAGDA